MKNRNNNKTQIVEKKQERPWHLFLLSALYFSAIPQVLSKIFKPGNMPSIISTTPDKLIMFRTLVLGIMFLVAIPLIIARLSTPEKLNGLKEWQFKGRNIGKFIYMVLRICGAIFFLFYLGIEIAGINQF